ncbi:MAG: methyltransferase [Planctomycetota bacterium]|jgi:precorrin-6B methylase 2
MSRLWTADEVLETARSYQSACVLAAAGDLDLFGTLGEKSLTANEVARAVGSDVRATVVLLDALAAMDLLDKHDHAYRAAPGARELLTSDGSGSVLAMVQHQANCLRRWVLLSLVVKTGRATERRPSIRGEDADTAAFVGAMDNICAPIADQVIEDLGPLQFRHVLDVGGASGTWTVAWLRRYPDARATLFDLPHVIPMAQRRTREAGFSDRVEFVGGDFESDPLPRGADLAWVSAIIHQNSREQNRRLFRDVFEALSDDGRILIRDVIMNESRTSPAFGALFAINMLVATEGGGTFTVGEMREDLEVVGFRDVKVIRHDEDMNSVVSAGKPK